MTFLSSILAFLIVFGIIVLVHEFGHYIAARLVGVRVEVFSFGFGKRIWGKKVGHTDYRLSLVPLGGFIRMAGEEEYDPDDIKPYEFPAKNRGQRMFILVMGALMNLFLAFIIFTTINITGVEIEKYKQEAPVLNYIQKDSPAEKAGLKPGDRIVSLGGREIEDWKDLELNISANPNENLEVVFLRGGERKTVFVDVESVSRYSLGSVGVFYGFTTRIDDVDKDSPAEKAGFKKEDLLVEIDGEPVTVWDVSKRIGPSAGKEMNFKVKRGDQFLELKAVPVEIEKDGEKKGIIGVAMSGDNSTIITHYGVWGGMVKAKNDMVELTFFIFNAFRKMIVGKISARQLSGPIEIAQVSQRAMEQGPGSLFLLIAFISLQLGLVNLLPIPVLDGGHLMILSIETIIRRDFNNRIKIVLMNMGFFLLVGIMAFVLLNDLAKVLPNGWSSFWPF